MGAGIRMYYLNMQYCSSAKYFVSQHVSQTQRDSHCFIIMTAPNYTLDPTKLTAYHDLICCITISQTDNPQLRISEISTCTYIKGATNNQSDMYDVQWNISITIIPYTTNFRWTKISPSPDTFVLQKYSVE